MHETLLITDNIQRATEDGLFSCGIFLGFSKAFDTIDQSVLIRKLGHYGIHGIANDWFTSHLHMIGGDMFLLEALSLMTLLLHMESHRDWCSTFFYFSCISMTSVIAANYLTF